MRDRCRGDHIANHEMCLGSFDLLLVAAVAEEIRVQQIIRRRRHLGVQAPDFLDEVGELFVVLNQGGEVRMVVDEVG